VQKKATSASRRRARRRTLAEKTITISSSSEGGREGLNEEGKQKEKKEEEEPVHMPVSRLDDLDLLIFPRPMHTPAFLFATTTTGSSSSSSPCTSPAASSQGITSTGELLLLSPSPMRTPAFLFPTSLREPVSSSSSSPSTSIEEASKEGVVSAEQQQQQQQQQQQRALDKYVHQAFLPSSSSSRSSLIEEEEAVFVSISSNSSSSSSMTHVGGVEALPSMIIVPPLPELSELQGEEVEEDEVMVAVQQQQQQQQQQRDQERLQGVFVRVFDRQPQLFLSSSSSSSSSSNSLIAEEEVEVEGGREEAQDHTHAPAALDSLPCPPSEGEGLVASWPVSVPSSSSGSSSSNSRSNNNNTQASLIVIPALPASSELRPPPASILHGFGGLLAAIGAVPPPAAAAAATAAAATSPLHKPLGMPLARYQYYHLQKEQMYAEVADPANHALLSLPPSLDSPFHPSKLDIVHPLYSLTAAGRAKGGAHDLFHTGGLLHLNEKALLFAAKKHLVDYFGKKAAGPKFLRYLGRGTYACVVEVTPKGEGYSVPMAAKVYRLATEESKTSMAKWIELFVTMEGGLREVVAMKRCLGLKGVCQIKQVTFREGGMIVLMELAEKGALAQYASMSAERPKQEQVREWEVLLVVIVEELRSVRLIHHDIKPGNVFIRTDGRLVVGDFNVTAPANEEGRLQGVHGTPGFRAPEMLKGEWYDYRADLYSGGRTFLALALGFDAVSVHPTKKVWRHEECFGELLEKEGWTEGGVEVMRRLLAADPKERPSSEWVKENWVS
jgi:hypothetical protein